ncbi:MFS transporter [Timonella sp. A28]|uniref:MFS transporter n=1 Tax=Timonella sp. A28 TaxID=3442640 RepID=UPI003EB97D2D
MTTSIPTTVLPENGKTTNENQEKSKKAAVKSALAANYVDQFDIFVPVIALAPVTAQLFGEDNLAQTAGLVFVATLIGRPLGSLIFGPVADKYGRKTIAVVTLAGISLTTYAIALVPDHTSWGAWTLYWVIIMRFLGGLFLGGQYSAAIPLAMEWTRPRNRGSLSGGIMAMSPLANVTIAALTLLLLATLGIDTYAAWGWRIPFLISATLAAVMMCIYLAKVKESDTARQLHATPPTTGIKTTALSEVTLGTHRGTFARIFLLMTGLWIIANMTIPVVTRQLTALQQWTPTQVTLIMLYGTAIAAVSMWACGHLSTFLGRRKFFIIAGIVITLIAPPSYLFIWEATTLSGVIIWVVLLQIFTVSVYGPIGAYLSEKFPTHVRSTGYGLGYSLSIVIPALYPYYLPSLQNQFGEYGAVGLLLALSGILIMSGAVLERRQESLLA